MKTVNSLSGGKTSSYIAATNCLFPDAKIRQIVSDKIGTEFIGTLEEDTIIYTMLDLEQFIGQEIDWVSGKTFDEIINRNGKMYLPNVTQRFCTTEMKLQPIFNWWKSNFDEPVIMRIGFRANEMRRAKNMVEKSNKNGCLEFKDIVGQSKNGRNKWKNIEWQKPEFPLINDAIFKDTIENYWQDKPVRFAYMNNCVGCFHRNEILLKYMSEKHPNKFQWFCDQENKGGYGSRTFKNGMTYTQIKKWKTQLELFDDDFNECDSGYCGM